MSQVDAKSFLERVTKNEAFRREVMSKLQEGAERTPQQLIHLGAQHGLTFTETELVDAWEESQSTDQRALSDSELDGVTGGALKMRCPNYWKRLSRAKSSKRSRSTGPLPMGTQGSKPLSDESPSSQRSPSGQRLAAQST